LRRAVKIDPTDCDVRVDLSRLLARQGDLAAAVHESELALKLDGSNAAAHNQHGMLLEAQADLAGAAAEYRRALQLRAGFPQAQRNLRRVIDLTDAK
jgi:Flp pilus assembly protein TadD